MKCIINETNIPQIQPYNYEYVKNNYGIYEKANSFDKRVLISTHLGVFLVLESGELMRPSSGWDAEKFIRSQKTVTLSN